MTTQEQSDPDDLKADASDKDIRLMAHALRARGYAIVPLEPTIEMVEAGFRKGYRQLAKHTRDVIRLWAPHAGAPHPAEPGLVSAVRQAIKAGAIGLTADADDLLS